MSKKCKRAVPISLAREYVPEQDEHGVRSADFDVLCGDGKLRTYRMQRRTTTCAQLVKSRFGFLKWKRMPVERNRAVFAFLVQNSAAAREMQHGR